MGDKPLDFSDPDLFHTFMCEINIANLYVHPHVTHILSKARKVDKHNHINGIRETKMNNIKAPSGSGFRYRYCST